MPQAEQSTPSQPRPRKTTEKGQKMPVAPSEISQIAQEDGSQSNTINQGGLAPPTSARPRMLSVPLHPQASSPPPSRPKPTHTTLPASLPTTKHAPAIPMAVFPVEQGRSSTQNPVFPPAVYAAETNRRTPRGSSATKPPFMQD
ncbi:hypothetical protein RhiJN_07769 [Ceratobasidium sp. AG-Ba]|nr:hypothetical protein RhiJN_07769 [Ceratobasidium sp. AG-Ba]